MRYKEDIGYLYHELRRRGVFEAYPESFRDEEYRTLVIVIAERRQYNTFIVVTRTSRQCFRVLYDGVMYHYRKYGEAADWICALLQEIQEKKAYWEELRKRDPNWFQRWTPPKK